MALEFNWLDLLTAIGSISVGFASFIFTWYRTKVKGPNIQVIEIAKSSVEKTKMVESYVDDEYKKDQWGFTLSFKGDNKINLQLITQNLGDRNAFIRIENAFLVGLASTGILAFPMEKNPRELLRFFVNPNPWQSIPLTKQISTDELSLIELSFQIPEKTKTLEAFLLFVEIKTWNHKGEESYVLSEPSVFSSTGLTPFNQDDLQELNNKIKKLQKKKKFFDIRDIRYILLKNFFDRFEKSEVIENLDQLRVFSNEFEPRYLLGDIYYSKFNKLKTE